MFPGRSDIEQEMRWSVKELKSKAGDESGNGKGCRAVDSDPGRQRQHGASAGNPKQECRNVCGPYDIAEQWGSGFLQREHHADDTKTESQHNRQAPSAPVGQTTNNSAKWSRHQEKRILRLPG